MKEASESVDYNFPKISKSKWSLLLFGTFVFAFFLYFPITGQIESKLKQTLAGTPGCSISYNDLDFDLLLPKFVITDLKLPAACFGQSGGPLTLEKTFLHIRGLNFAPFGPHFKLETELFKTPLQAYITAGFGSLAVNIQDADVQLENLASLLPAGIKLAGAANLNLLATVGTRGLKDFDLKVVSKNFALPAQSVNAFSFSRMNINDLLLKSEMDEKGVLNISELVVGDVNSPIRANFSGRVDVNQNVPALSKMNLLGEVAFSESFLDQYAIIGMVMNQFDKKDDFYQIQLQGTLTNPVPSSPDK